MRKLIQNLLLRIVTWLEPKPKEVPRKKKLEARKFMQPHIEKRIEMGAIAEPFGSCLAIVDNLTVVIEIMISKFKVSDKSKRRIDQVNKDLSLAKRQFAIIISDKYAEVTYGKELDTDQELVAIYGIFDGLIENEVTARKRDIYLEEWALNMKRDIDLAFKELLEISNLEEIPIRPVLYNSMSPDVKIRKADEPKNPPKKRPEDEDDEESDYPDDMMF